MDVLVLGCTHYPILKSLIQQIVGLNCRVIDSAEQCAEDVARRLQSAGLLRGAEPVAVARPSAAASWLKTFVTDNSPRFATLASKFLGTRIDAPRWVHPEELHAATFEPVVRRAV
jgi:glutamate racemase